MMLRMTLAANVGEGGQRTGHMKGNRESSLPYALSCALFACSSPSTVFAAGFSVVVYVYVLLDDDNLMRASERGSE